MGRLPRRTFVQGSMTAAVLVAGITATATGAMAGGAAATAAPIVRPAVAPGPATGVQPAGRMTHPAHEAWSRLLASPRAGWTVSSPAAPLSGSTLSSQFAIPGKVRAVLHTDGYERGVQRVTRSGRTGVIEQLWHFRSPQGAKSWYLTYVGANRPHSGSSFTAMQLVGHHGDVAFTATRLDGAGLHYGVALALDGDMIVHVRVFGPRPVGQPRLIEQLRRAERPVARGIAMPGLGPVTDRTSIDA